MLRLMVMRGSALTCGTAVLLLAAGCSGTAEDAVEVSGTLRQTGGPLGVPQPGVPGMVTFRGGDDRSVEADAASDGTFTLRLPPGSYTVEGRSPTFAGGQGVCRADDVRVASRAVAGIVVACPRR